MVKLHNVVIYYVQCLLINREVDKSQLQVVKKLDLVYMIIILILNSTDHEKEEPSTKIRSLSHYLNPWLSEEARIVWHTPLAPYSFDDRTVKAVNISFDRVNTYC